MDTSGYLRQNSPLHQNPRDPRKFLRGSAIYRLSFIIRTQRDRSDKPVYAYIWDFKDAEQRRTKMIIYEREQDFRYSLSSSVTFPTLLHLTVAAILGFRLQSRCRDRELSNCFCKNTRPSPTFRIS